MGFSPQDCGVPWPQKKLWGRAGERSILPGDIIHGRNGCKAKLTK
jgi:hypothetical protein